MIKLKNLFAKPLVTSNSKISPFTNETYDPQETTKPEEVVTSQPNELKTGRFLQKSRSFFPVQAPSRPKKNSLPPVMKKPPETKKDIGFDFEQFEELVDKKKLGLSREATIIMNEDNEDRAAKVRRHSWSVTDQGIAQHSVEMLKKFQFPPINTNLVSTGNVLASPTVRSPLNQSRVDETAGLLELGETHRKEYLSPAESFEELKVRERRKSASSTGVRRTSEKTLSMIPQRGDFETTEAENNFNEEKRMSVKENKEHSFEQEEQRIDGNYENENIGSIEESSHQREMFKKLSVSLALTQRFDGSGAVLKPPSIQDMESSNSNLDSLVEENPFEDEITVRARTVSLKRQKTRIRDDKKYAGVKWILFPDDTWKKVSDIIIALGLVYTALVMPIRVTFIQDEPGDRLWPAFDWIIDGIFILDMIITFFSAYFDGEENLVYQKKKIMMHYLTGWFVLDAISVAPFYLLNDGDNQSDRINNLVRVARLPRLYKLVKIVKLIRMVKIVKDRDKFKNYMNGILKLSAAYERMAVGTIGILLFCHIAACLWFTLVDLGDSAEDWLSTNELDYVSRFSQYIASFYFVVQTVVTVGYGELSPKTKEERLLACFLMIVGVLFYSIFIGFVSSLINDMDQMNQRFNHKLHILHRLQKDYSLPVFFVKKLKKAIKYESKQTIDSKLFVDHLPKQLSVELFCVMHKDIIDSIAFLQNRPKAFIAALCPLLKPITINKKDMIFTEGDPADEIFFVKSGTVGYVLPKFKNECFLKVREGYFFGEIDLLFYGETRKYTAMALKDCELYVLNKKDFKQVFLTSFRDIGNALCENAYKRKQRTRKAYKEALEICKSRQDDSHHKHKHSKLRLTLTKREKFGYGEADSEDSEDSAEVPNALMGIVEEEEEEEEEILQPPPPAEEEEPEQIVIEPHKSLGGLSRLKAALALKRAFAPKSQMIQSLVMPSKESVKEEAKFGELNKKIDGLEAKLAKILTIGHAIRSQSSKDLNSPSLQNQSLALSRIIQTPTNKVKTPVDNASPSGSDSPMSTFRSPNALRRNIGLKKAENPAFKVFTSIKHFGLAASSAGPENESDRLLTQTARTTTQRETYGDVKTIGNSEHDPMVITDNNYEMKEEEEKGSSTEERERKEKEEDEKKMQPVYKLLFNLGKKKPVKEDSLKAPGTPASQAEMSNLSKTKSNLEFEDF